MADAVTTPPAVTAGNDPAIRTETGEIKDQQTSLPTTDQKPDTSTATADTKDTSLLNKDGKEPAKEPVKDDKTTKTKGVPEKYEFKAPDGYEIDAKFIEQATPVLKELGLSNEQAQKLVNLQIEREKATAEAPYKLYEEMRNGWRKDVVSDPTLGDGSSLKSEVRASIGRMFDSVGDAKLVADFKQSMDTTGAGDNPAFVKLMYKMSQMLGEGTGVKGKGPSTLGQTSPDAKPKSAANALYPNLPSSSTG